MGQQRKGRGSSSRADKRPSKPAAIAEELIPHKIVGELIGKRLNGKGEIVGEEVMGPIAIFAANFDKLPKLIEQDLERSREAEQALEKAAGPSG